MQRKKCQILQIWGSQNRPKSLLEWSKDLVHLVLEWIDTMISTLQGSKRHLTMMSDISTISYKLQSYHSPQHALSIAFLTLNFVLWSCGKKSMDLKNEGALWKITLWLPAPKPTMAEFYRFTGIMAAGMQSNICSTSMISNFFPMSPGTQISPFYQSQGLPYVPPKHHINKWTRPLPFFRFRVMLKPRKRRHISKPCESMVIPPWKLTWQWEITMFNRRFSIFIHGWFFQPVMLVFRGVISSHFFCQLFSSQSSRFSTSKETLGTNGPKSLRGNLSEKHVSRFLHLGMCRMWVCISTSSGNGSVKKAINQ